MLDINRNFAWCDAYVDDSFIGILHERSIWDDDEYFKLEGSLYGLCEQFNQSDSLPRDVAWKIFRIFSYLMVSLASHSELNDGFTVSNLSDEQFFNRRERLQLVFEGFFEGKMPDKEILEY